MKEVVIYTGSRCIFCEYAKALLNRKGVTYNEIFIEYDDTNKMEEMIKKSNGMKTVPQIFRKDEYIGGYNQLFKYVCKTYNLDENTL